MYTEDPEAVRLRQEIKDMNTKNSMLRSKINFHVSRTNDVIRSRSGSPARYSEVRSSVKRVPATESQMSRKLVDAPGMVSSQLRGSHYVSEFPYASTRTSGVHQQTSGVTFGGSGTRVLSGHPNNRYSVASPNNILSTSIRR